MLADWLKDPKQLSEVLGIKPEDLKKFTPEELVKYFLERLKEQTERHDGGNRWIGTGGTSPVGHSGFHPGGMRVGGVSRNKSAMKLALERRYKDYSQQGPLSISQIGEALRRLKNMVPVGPKDKINIEKTIYETVRNAGEIELLFRRSRKNAVKLLLLMDVGGSMEPYAQLCNRLFSAAHSASHFKDFEYYYFHNSIYDRLFTDVERSPAVGTNHILPTSRSARYSGGVWVGKFLKTVTYQKMTPEASIEVGEVTARQCEIERMLAHGITATVRTKRYAKK